MSKHPALAALDKLAPARMGGKRWLPPTELADMIIARRRDGISCAAIAETLTANNVPVAEGTLRKWLKDQGVT